VDVAPVTGTLPDFGVGAGIGVAVGVVGFKSARNGGRVEPERSFVNCVDASDLRIAAPGRPGPPRLRNALAVQARKPKRPRRAPPPSLDETALGGLGRSGALYTACTGFNFALQTPFYTRCAPAATPRPSQATLRVHTLWSPRRLVLRPRPPTQPRPSNPRALRMSSGSMASG
jgi:hypothetical protein